MKVPHPAAKHKVAEQMRQLLERIGKFVLIEKLKRFGGVLLEVVFAVLGVLPARVESYPRSFRTASSDCTHR